MKSLVKLLRSNLNISNDVSLIIFGDARKALSSKPQQIKAKENLKVFNNLKAIVKACSSDDNMVDLTLLDSLLKEKRYRLKII
jgi:hypothetical protein